MENRINDLASYRLEKAGINLDLATELYNTEVYGVALNRAYYAAFDAMRAVNALDGFDSSKHSGVIAHFNQNHVKTGHFERATSNIIKRASLLREKSDYEDFYEPNKEEVEKTIEEIGSFLEAVENYLNTAVSANND